MLSHHDLSSYKGLRNYLLIYLMSHLGLRQTEARTLKAHQIRKTSDGQGHKIFIQIKVKGGHERKIPITDYLYCKLQEIVNLKLGFRLPANHLFLFTSTIRRNRPLTSMQVNRIVRRYAPNSQITPHSLRVYFINRVATKTNNNAIITQRLAGHADVRTTIRYLREREELSVMPEEIVK